MPHAQSLTTAQIEELIPHRAPMLLVSSVSAWSPEDSITTHHAYPPETLMFQGHFPGNPVLPGIVLVESMAQSAALLTSLSKGLTHTTASYLFMGMSDVRFRSMVKPNDEVTFSVKKTGEKLGVLTFTGVAECNGKRAAEASFTAKLLLTPTNA